MLAEFTYWEANSGPILAAQFELTHQRLEASSVVSRVLQPETLEHMADDGHTNSHIIRIINMYKRLPFKYSNVLFLGGFQLCEEH